MASEDAPPPHHTTTISPQKGLPLPADSAVTLLGCRNHNNWWEEPIPRIERAEQPTGTRSHCHFDQSRGRQKFRGFYRTLDLCLPNFKSNWLCFGCHCSPLCFPLRMGLVDSSDGEIVRIGWFWKRSRLHVRSKYQMRRNVLLVNIIVDTTFLESMQTLFCNRFLLVKVSH